MKWKSKNFRQIDEDTGEILDGFTAVLQPKRRNGFNQGWMAMSLYAPAVLKQVKRVEDFRVFFALLECLDFENLILISQAEIAEDLNMKRQSVNQAIKRLIELGAIIEGPKVSRSRSYKLNPEFGWKGSASNHMKALKEHDALKERMNTAGMSVVSDDSSNPETNEVN